MARSEDPSKEALLFHRDGNVSFRFFTQGAEIRHHCDPDAPAKFRYDRVGTAPEGIVFQAICPKCSFRFQIIQTKDGLDLESIEVFVAHGQKIVIYSWDDGQDDQPSPPEDTPPPIEPSSFDSVHER